MTVTEKRATIVASIKSREGRNTYTQGSKRDQVASGWSDCSSLVRWAYQQVGIEIGGNTEAQMLSSQLANVVVPIDAGVPRESYLLPGDLLYFRGRNTERKATKYVGHVEMYLGGGELSGHGSGIGPTRKNMVDYCRKRQASSSPVPAGNRGLICVRRAVALIEEDPQSDQDYVASLYRDLLGRDPDAGGLNGWVAALRDGMSRDEVRQGFLRSEEYQRKHSAPDTPVMAYQRWLNSYLEGCLGEPLVMDGTCGPATRRAAIMAMQVYLNHTCGAGLAVDGSFGTKTKAAYATVRRGVKGDNVRIVQGLLYGRGYDPDGFDGSCGPGCEAAIRRFQSDTDDLEVDGHCGKATFAALVG